MNAPAIVASALTNTQARVLEDYLQEGPRPVFAATAEEWIRERAGLLAAELIANVRPGSLVCRITNEGREALRLHRERAGKGRAT